MSAVLLARYRAILCDLDGCLVSGETVLPGAQAFIELVLATHTTTSTGRMRWRRIKIASTE